MSPYYIVAPRYIRTSAGCRVLYRLCDLINKSGGTAFIYLRPHLEYELAGSPMDVAPLLTEKIVDYHFKAGIAPIAIYPENFKIAKFSAPFRVRYVLNYDQLLNTNEPREKDDYILSYSENILTKLDTDKPKRIVFLPVSDPNFYHLPSTKNLKRSGGVFYAGKFKYHFSGKTFPLTKGMPEITRDKPHSQTPEQIRDLFQRSEFFYCYEDSALVVEAILCGCPVVLLPNEYFKEPLGAKELKGLGYAWGDSPEQLDHARSTVAAARERYLELLEDADKSVKEFIKETQELVKGVEYKVPFALGYLHGPSRVQIFLDYFRFIREVIEDYGLKKTIQTIFKRLRARRFKIY